MNEEGWDSVVLDVDDEWIVRVPRRPAIAGTYAAEARLLEAIAPALPAPVPRFRRVGESFVVYAKLRGTPLYAHLDEPALGAALGRFVRALHSFPLERASGVQRARRAGPDDLAPALPLLEPDERARGDRLLEAYRAFEFEPAIVHGDLRVDHVLCEERRITGVIDWGDAGVGDPARDVAWALFDTPPPLAQAFAAAYGVDRETAERAEVHWRLGPWLEVVFAGSTGRPDSLERGLAALRARLPGAADDPDTMAR